MTTTKRSEARGAFFVAAGILASRVAGLVRLRAFAHYFGLQSDAADAFNAAFRIPNLLQNLFGEGALSASFIPVYASLLGRGDAHQPANAMGWNVAALDHPPHRLGANLQDLGGFLDGQQGLVGQWRRCSTHGSSFQDGGNLPGGDLTCRTPCEQVSQLDQRRVAVSV